MAAIKTVEFSEVGHYFPHDATHAHWCLDSRNILSGGYGRPDFWWLPQIPQQKHLLPPNQQRQSTEVASRYLLQVIWYDASRSQWQEYALEIGKILHIFPSGTQSMGNRGSKKAYTGPRTGTYLPTKYGCDWSIVVGCRSQNDWQTDKQTEWNDNKAHSMRCERVHGYKITQMLQWVHPYWPAVTADFKDTQTWKEWNRQMCMLLQLSVTII